MIGEVLNRLVGMGLYSPQCRISDLRKGRVTLLILGVEGHSCQQYTLACYLLTQNETRTPTRYPKQVEKLEMKRKSI